MEFFSDGQLKFNGNFSKGKRNGKGIEYYYDGRIKFEGEYLMGKKWNGIGYDFNKNVVFVLKNGNGLMKEYELMLN